MNRLRQYFARRDALNRELAKGAVRESQEIVATVFGALVDNGSAEIREQPEADDPGVLLQVLPKAQNAAPVEIAIDGVLMSVAVGRHERVVEISLKDPSWAQTLRSVLEAVASGDYSERLEKGRLGRTVVMRFDSAQDSFEVKHTSLVDTPNVEHTVESYSAY